MYYPTFDKVRQLKAAETVPAVEKPGRPLLPFYCDILADLETPVSAYCKAAQGPYSFLLESVTGGERVGRYSFIGFDPYMVIIHRGERATIYRTKETLWRDIPGTPSATMTSSGEDIPCHDPLSFLEAELAQGVGGQAHLKIMEGIALGLAGPGGDGLGHRYFMPTG